MIGHSCLYLHISGNIVVLLEPEVDITFRDCPDNPLLTSSIPEILFPKRTLLVEEQVFNMNHGTHFIFKP